MNYSETIAQLKSKYPFLAVVEVWENVLFLRMSQGRCVFHGKKGTIFAVLEVGTWVLAADNELEAKQVYKKMATKLHPDKVSGSHEKFIKLKTSYEHYKTIRARFGPLDSQYFSDYFRDYYYEYRETEEERKRRKERIKREMEKYGVPF